MAVRFSRKKQTLLLAVVLALAALAAASQADVGPTQVLNVRYVPDGDTIMLQDGTLVRYIGIDAPETAKKLLPAQPFSQKARSANQKLVKKGVRLEYGPELMDRYGRALAYVYTEDGIFVNAQMLRLGLAWCLFVAPNTNRFEQLLAVQRLAMDEEQGIWAGMGKTNGPVVGNPRSMRFHLQQHYAPTKNAKLFNSVWDAFYEGYSPCSTCLPSWQKTKWPEK
ncbi:MAG: thermonuclease family protein [Desulfatibacillaceae bacterium]|nr:thermonuclease family protein [Desulfatibacillaceae bacterium]